MRYQELALLGRVTASTSHEFKNVLAILRESFGLIKDVLDMNGKNKLKHQDKIDRALDNVERHMSRGVDITNRLNLFAHTTDEDRDTVSFSGLADLACHLLKRRARQGKVALAFEVASGGLDITGCPMILLTAILACVEHAIEHSPQDSSLMVRAQRGSGGPQLAITQSGPEGDLNADALQARLDVMENLDPPMTVQGTTRGLTITAQSTPEA